MAGWTDIFDDVDGSPVRGAPAEFRAARDHFGRMEEDASAIVAQFSRFRGDGQASGSFEGDAAQAFATFVDEVGGELEDLPRVAGDAHGILDHHGGELNRLLSWAEEGADSALARARTAWAKKHDLEAAAGRLRSQVTQLQGQVDAAQDAADSAPEPDPAADGEVDQLNGQLGSSAGALRDTEEAIEHESGVLAGIRGEWDDIRGDEERLNETTVSDLDGIDLGDLEDPGLFERIVGGVAGFVGAVIDVALGPLDEILVALVNGDWATLLWELKELLDTVLVVLAVVALVFPLTAPFMAAIFIISAVAFAVTTALYVTQMPNPETGKTIGLGDVVLSGVGVALGAAGGLSALQSVRGLSSSFVPRSGLSSLLKTGRDIRSVVTAGDDAAAAAQSLGVHVLPFPAGTPLTQSIPALIRAPGGPMATARLVNSLNGAMPGTLNFIPGRPTTTENAINSVGTGSLFDGLGVDAGAPPNPAVFQRIAHRQRFDPPVHWNHPSLPWGQQLQIIPA